MTLFMDVEALCHNSAKALIMPSWVIQEKMCLGEGGGWKRSGNNFLSFRSSSILWQAKHQTGSDNISGHSWVPWGWTNCMVSFHMIYRLNEGHWRTLCLRAYSGFSTLGKMAMQPMGSLCHEQDIGSLVLTSPWWGGNYTQSNDTYLVNQRGFLIPQMRFWSFPVYQLGEKRQDFYLPRLFCLDLENSGFALGETGETYTIFILASTQVSLNVWW